MPAPRFIALAGLWLIAALPGLAHAAREAQRGAVRVAEHRRLKRLGAGAGQWRSALANVAAVQRRAQRHRTHLARAAGGEPADVGVRRRHYEAREAT